MESNSSKLQRFLNRVFGNNGWQQLGHPIEEMPTAYVVINGVSITPRTAIAVSLIDSQETGYVVHIREDGQLSCYQVGADHVTVITREKLVELINEPKRP